MLPERTSAWIRRNLRFAAEPSGPPRLPGPVDYYRVKPPWLLPSIASARSLIMHVRQAGGALLKEIEEQLRAESGSSLEEIKGLLSKMESEGVNVAGRNANYLHETWNQGGNPLYSSLFQKYVIQAMRDAVAPPSEENVDVRDMAILLVKEGNTYKLNDLLWRYDDLMGEEYDEEFVKRLFASMVEAAKNFQDRPDMSSIFSRIMHKKENVLSEMAMANPSIVREWPWFWMDYSPAPPKEICSILIGLIPSLKADDMRLWKIENVARSSAAYGIPGAGEAYVACMRNNPFAARQHAVSYVSNKNLPSQSLRDIPEAEQYVEALVRESASDPGFLGAGIMQAGSRFEESMAGLGIAPQEGPLLTAYRDVLQKKLLNKDSVGSMLYVFRGTKTARKALLEFTSYATEEEDIPNLESCFFLRADLVQRKVAKQFVNSWKGISRDMNCQAIHMIVEEGDEFKGEHPVGTFFPDEMPSDLGPGREKELMETMTSQASREAMKRAISEMYRTTQQTLVEDILRKDPLGKEILVKNDRGEYVGVRLWRGVKAPYSVPSSLESWSSNDAIARRFDDHAVWESIVPLRAILVSCVSPNWGETYNWRSNNTEYEYVIIRSHISVGSVKKESPDYMWTPSVSV